MRSIAGAQAQEPRAGRLQVRARSRGLTSDEVERARVEERSIVRTWAMRGTVHLIAADDAAWISSLYAESLVRDSRKRLAELGMPAATQDRALAMVEAALNSEAPLRRDHIAEQLRAGGIALHQQARFHMMRLAVVSGIACLGPDLGGSASLVLAREWLGEPRRPEREDALARLARLYLRAFGPAGERDLAFWSGLPLRDCRVGLERIAPELVELDRDPLASPPGGGPLLALAGAVTRAPRSPLVRLLPAYDTYLMGYASRSHAVDRAGERRILPGGGVLRPTICLDGRLVGLWSSRRSGSRLRVSIEPFEPLSDVVLGLVAREVADVGRFEGLGATLDMA